MNCKKLDVFLEKIKSGDATECFDASFFMIPNWLEKRSDKKIDKALKKHQKTALKVCNLKTRIAIGGSRLKWLNENQKALLLAKAGISAYGMDFYDKALELFEKSRDFATAGKWQEMVDFVFERIDWIRKEQAQQELAKNSSDS